MRSQVLRSAFHMLSSLAGPPLFATLYARFFANQPTWQGWVDGLSYGSLLVLMAWGVLYVIHGGFFTAFWLSCKRFFASWRRQEDFLRQVEGTADPYMGSGDEKQEKAVYQAEPVSHGLLLWAGVGYFLLSFFCSLSVSL